MNTQIKSLLNRFELTTSHECVLALRETLQEIALVGLWRAKFFEHAAFYGGTALRIFYGLDRYSEDMDFSLLEPSNNFSLTKFNTAIIRELEAYGFTARIEEKQKTHESQIESEFINANTYQELLRIGIPDFSYKGLHAKANLKIKIEIDTNPPQKFQTETKTLLQPTPVGIRLYHSSDLFAGKMHATLCRLWQRRIKGRDWYDFAWYIRHKVPLNLEHLQERMWQSGCLDKDIQLSKDIFIDILNKKIENLDIENALRDIQPFVTDQAKIASWSRGYFLELANKIEFFS